MPAEHSKTHLELEDALSPALTHELEQVASLIREHVHTVHSTQDALALVRIVKNISPEAWEHFASVNNLESWMALPLGGDLASSISTFLTTLEHMAFQRDHDALTGIANRRLFERRLDMEIERAMRSSAELCLMMLDLDSFKKVNDTYGHACGDTVLRRLGEVLTDSVRPYDLPARIGGEEFALIFPATSCWTGAMLGNRILEKFSAEAFTHGQATFSMTFSAGIASIALLEGAITKERLMAVADEALYTAKREGKNRVLIAESGKRSRDRATLVLSHEKQLLFSS